MNVVVVVVVVGIITRLGGGTHGPTVKRVLRNYNAGLLMILARVCVTSG